MPTPFNKLSPEMQEGLRKEFIARWEDDVKRRTALREQEKADRARWEANPTAVDPNTGETIWSVDTWDYYGKPTKEPFKPYWDGPLGESPSDIDMMSPGTVALARHIGDDAIAGGLDSYLASLTPREEVVATATAAPQADPLANAPDWAKDAGPIRVGPGAETLIAKEETEMPLGGLIPYDNEVQDVDKLKTLLSVMRAPAATAAVQGPPAQQWSPPAGGQSMEPRMTPEQAIIAGIQKPGPPVQGPSIDQALAGASLAGGGGDTMFEGGAVANPQMPVPPTAATGGGGQTGLPSVEDLKGTPAISDPFTNLGANVVQNVEEPPSVTPTTDTLPAPAGAGGGSSAIDEVAQNPATMNTAQAIGDATGEGGFFGFLKGLLGGLAGLIRHPLATLENLGLGEEELAAANAERARKNQMMLDQGIQGYTPLAPLRSVGELKSLNKSGSGSWFEDATDTGFLRSDYDDQIRRSRDRQDKKLGMEDDIAHQIGMEAVRAEIENRSRPTPANRTATRERLTESRGDAPAGSFFSGDIRGGDTTDWNLKTKIWNRMKWPTTALGLTRDTPLPKDKVIPMLTRAMNDPNLRELGVPQEQMESDLLALMEDVYQDLLTEGSPEGVFLGSDEEVMQYVIQEAKIQYFNDMQNYRGKSFVPNPKKLMNVYRGATGGQ